MEEKEISLVNSCNFSGIRPIMMELPNPSIQVKEKNQTYANLLSIDHSGSISELSAITQYVNHENRLSMQNCAVARSLLGIAMAEMIHLQMLGQLIILLGGNVDYSVKRSDGRRKLWTPEYLSFPDNAKKMISVNIEGEKSAINQYRMHMKMINDSGVNAVLARIIKDEEYHIMFLQALMCEV